jgi:hypothetical protein
MVAAIMGARARLGVRGEHHEEFQAQKEAAERKKKTTITAESFDTQVADKMGGFFDEVFLPTMKNLVEAGLSYDDVKRLVKIPTTWGAKITGEVFRRRTIGRARHVRERPQRVRVGVAPTARRDVALAGELDVGPRLLVTGGSCPDDRGTPHQGGGIGPRLIGG